MSSEDLSPDPPAHRRETNEHLKLVTDYIELKTRGRTDIVDITPHLTTFLKDSELADGSMTVFVPGSTAALTTIEYEPGLLKDLPELFEKLIPTNRPYHHHQTWHDDNGSSHLRAALVGPSISIPFKDGRPILGTWQQVVFVDFDTRPRNRKIVVHAVGSPRKS